MTYEETPIGKITEQAKKDMDLIRKEVEAKDWKAVIHGVKHQLEVFTELLITLRAMERRGRFK